MDGDLDIYLANDFGYWLEPNVLYENTDGKGVNERHEKESLLLGRRFLLGRGCR